VIGGTYQGSLLVPGHSCWKTTVASQLSMIQDAALAFTAIAEAMEAARRTIYIVGWDIDSRTVLRPGATQPEDSRLLPLLCRCLDRQPVLEVFILIWDFSIIYAWEREPLPRRQFGRVHPRLHFALDPPATPGASHHQKIVVVDDQVAFVGGIDITTHRWDTSEHRPSDPRRVDLAGTPYEPFHDVHAAVSGPAAAALGELARERWRGGRRRAVAAPVQEPQGGVTAWPSGLPVDATGVRVGLARTLAFRKGPAVKEIETLTLKGIAAAQQWIYAENQYLTSPVVARALIARLLESGGPEIVLVLPKQESGWMEQSSMGVLRAQVFGQLVRHDRHGRLRLVTPLVSTATLTRYVQIHSKVLVIDNRLAKIGSANFSRRSFGLDSECDLAVEAVDDASAAFVESVRNRLVGEHLGLAPAEVAARLAQHGSLNRVIDDQPTDARRRLTAAPTTVDAIFDLALLDGAFVDPDAPWNGAELLERAVPVPLRRRLARRWLRPAAIVASVTSVWAVFRVWHPLTAELHPLVERTVLAVAEQPAGWLLAIVFYTVAAILCLPATLLATATLAVFGLWPGVPIAWLGGVFAATLSHGLGGLLGPRLLRWLPDRIERSVRRFLRRRGFWSVVFIRLVPLGSFGILNLVAGALRIPRTSFVLGNMVGLLPGLLGLGLIVDRLRALVREPSLVNVSVAVLALVGVVVLAVMAKRRFRPEREA
jgi:phospholipase D1/2